jgi:plastocyanin
MGRSAILMLVLGLALAGCSATKTASTTPPASTTPTPSASDTGRGRPIFPSGVTLTTKPSAAAAGSVTVGAPDNDIAFTPDIVYIKAGGTVNWKLLLRGGGAGGHNVTFVDGPEFEANLNQYSQSASRVFTTPGTYRYVCTIHPPMIGEVVVS